MSTRPTPTTCPQSEGCNRGPHDNPGCRPQCLRPRNSTPNCWRSDITIASAMANVFRRYLPQGRKRRRDFGRPCQRTTQIATLRWRWFPHTRRKRRRWTKYRQSPLAHGLAGAHAVERAVYGFPSLNKYAIDPAKPIRISVQTAMWNYGVVDSQADKDTASYSRNGVPGVFQREELSSGSQPGN